MALNLVAISEKITANSGDGDVPTCQPCNDTGVGGTIFVCRGCDTACGRVSYFGTADVFAGYRSEPAFSQQRPDIPECRGSIGDCTPCLEDPGNYNCGCAYIDEYSSMSYARFSNKQFISIKENGVYKNRKMTESEYLQYINKYFEINIPQNQSHEMNCPGYAAPQCNGTEKGLFGGTNINSASCISSSSRGDFPCRLVIVGEGESTQIIFDTKTFFSVGPLWQTTFSNGLNSVNASYGLQWIQDLNSEFGTLAQIEVLIPPVTPLAENKEDTLFNYLKCANQNYLFGNKNNVPDGVTAVFIADYINETFTPELCDLVDSCSLGGAAACESFNLANCKKEMDSLCFNRAERYGIIKGCTSASGFTLGHVRYESKNRDDFVFFFQGINTGNRNTLSPIGSTPEGAEEIVSFGITYNDCFGYYSVEFEGQSVCKRPGLMADPMYFSDAFSIDEVYLPTDTDTCDVLLGSRLINLYPPQHSGTCYMIDTAGNNITANDQFETISYFSKNSPFRATIFNNFIYPITKNLSENSISTYGSTDFLNKALCTYFMPRHPYYSQTIGEALPFYAYGYKPAPGFEGTIDINLCPRYDFYKSENEKKSSDPNYTIIPGHNSAFYSLMGELYCTNYGPIDDPGTGGGAGGGAGFVDDSICGNEPQFGEAACFFNVGIQNPLTPWPLTEDEIDPCEHTANAYGVKIYGHINDNLLPDNNVTKYFNACFPCRGFIDLPPNGHETALFTQYETIVGGIQRIIVKSYTREGNYTGHSVGSILARMTLKEQINQGNIYYTDAAYFTLSLIGSGIETLHTREITKKEYMDTPDSNGTYAGWNAVPNAAPLPSDYRARKLLLMQGLHPTHGETLNNIIDQSKVFFTNEYNNPMDPIFAKNFAYENGGYIGVNGQFVADYVFGQGEAGVPSEKYYNEIGNPNKVHGLFDFNNQINGAFDKSTSDRNPKVNNVTGILRVHKDYQIEEGRSIPVCREKFETKDGTLTNCNLPNNIVMNGLCWITTVLHSDIWEDRPREWAEEMDLQFAVPPEPGQPPVEVDYTSFETWLETTTVPTATLDNNFAVFIQSVGIAISNAKQNNSEKYIGTGQLDSIPTPITEELYLNRRYNGAYVYDFKDFREAAEASRQNDYSCYNPDSAAIEYSCEETFNCSENEDLGQTYCEFNSSSLSTLEQLEARMILSANSVFSCGEFIQGGKFTNIPTSPCMTSMIVNFNNATNANLFGSCGLTVSKATDLIQLMLDSRANPCIFQYNNKIYRVMK